MPPNIDRFAPQRSRKPRIFDPHGEAAEHHAAHRHLVDDGIKPFHEQKFQVGGFASHFHLNLRFDLRLRDDCCQRLRRLFERFRCGRTKSSQSDIGIVREMLPACLAGGRGGLVHGRKLCFPISFTVLACGPFSPASSAKVTRVPADNCGKAPSSTLLR